MGGCCNCDCRCGERCGAECRAPGNTCRVQGMIRGAIADSRGIENLHPRFRKAFGWLRAQDLGKLASGRYEIDGDDIYANVMEPTLKPWSDHATVEVHRAFIDIQVPIAGEEVCGYSGSEADVKAHEKDFNVKDDYVLFEGKGLEKVVVKPGEYVVFMPPFGAHAPALSESAAGRKHRKLVIKVRL